jgi:3',5'-cyclic AMP phosphodiesterase CpdA
MGVVYEFAPLLARRAGADSIADFFNQANGEAPTSFTFAQFSDPHVGFQGPPDPLGTKAFESAVELMNRSKQRPDFVLFTGDLTHDVPDRDKHAQRMQLFKSIAGRINTPALHMVPGENDAALDGGVLYREHFGDSHYSFDHKGVHFVALDNVSQGSPEGGAVWGGGTAGQAKGQGGPDLGVFIRKLRMSIDLQAGYGSSRTYGTVSVSRTFSWSE